MEQPLGVKAAVKAEELVVFVAVFTVSFFYTLYLHC